MSKRMRRSCSNVYYRHAGAGIRSTCPPGYVCKNGYCVLSSLKPRPYNLRPKPWAGGLVRRRRRRRRRGLWSSRARLFRGSRRQYYMRSSRYRYGYNRPGIPTGIGLTTNRPIVSSGRITYGSVTKPGVVENWGRKKGMYYTMRAPRAGYKYIYDQFGNRKEVPLNTPVRRMKRAEEPVKTHVLPPQVITVPPKNTGVIKDTSPRQVPLPTSVKPQTTSDIIQIAPSQPRRPAVTEMTAVSPIVDLRAKTQGPQNVGIKMEEQKTSIFAKLISPIILIPIIGTVGLLFFLKKKKRRKIKGSGSSPSVLVIKGGSNV